MIPSEDMAALEALIKELRGELVRAPLAGTEVAVVTPTLAIHHLPHTACDIAEYLRRHGAKSNMLGLARGVGREIAQINEYEAALINEHDAAVFIFGNFAECIRKKESLYRNISVPVVVTGGPEIPKADALCLRVCSVHRPSCPQGQESHGDRIPGQDRRGCGQGSGQDQECDSQGPPHYLTAQGHGCRA